ncbi:AfsR/SARP family transcriptional regulator [Micromonospora vulcania]|uniref:BTAD domain-containing putative transcriptional regulator n=1 Tax=Micromonospora vulcania TaxID=1441873 RepID=A0ABW1HAE7_9ACTN
MRFGILGPLRVGGGESTVTAGRDRIVLAMLLLRAGRLVPVEELVDAVWEENPPATARAQLQTCVSRLRRRFTELGLAPEIIVTDPVGYGVRLASADLDVEIFTQGVEAARAAVRANRLAEAGERFRSALALWRGPALGGIPSRSVRRRAQVLDEQRLSVLEECVEVELHLGRAAELIEELAGCVDQHPLRERLRGQLMLALSSAGRQADALMVYKEGRHFFADELGIEPGAELQELHQRVLAGDLALAGRDRGPIIAVRALPRAIKDFTGRQDTVARLVKEIEEDGGRIHSIDGMAGSGKTTLAVHVATAIADRYPDAQLFIDLHGHSTHAPLGPAAAAATLLRQLGVPAERVPVSSEDRLALWRSELAGRRALVVLDNAVNAHQVVPLLPNGPHCLVLVTSRRRLVGLDDARPSSLPVLDTDEAVELLGRLAGAERVAAEPAAAVEVVRRCGHLPLAIRLAGARLAHRPHWRVSDLAERLVAAGPLAELSAGERSVGQAFALSYAQVSRPAQRLFRLLGLYPGGRLDSRVAAALAELPLGKTQDLLDELVDAHLVEEAGAGRYRLHDLLREFAVLLLDAEDRRDERRAALERLLDHQLSVTVAIARSVESPGSRRTIPAGTPGRPDLVAIPAAQGRAWFEESLSVLTALVRVAEEEGFLAQCWQLARACWRLSFDGGHLDELVETHTIGLRAAERLGDEAAIAVMLNYLSSAYFRLARFPEVIQKMEVALDLRRRLGLRSDVLSTLWNLGGAYSAHGEFRQSMARFDEAFGMIRGLDDAYGLANLLNNQCMTQISWGRYDEALRTARLHLLLARQANDFQLTENAIGHLGMIRHRMGDLAPARRILRVALHLKRRQGNRFGEGEVLNEIGVMERVAGRPEEAATLHRDALVAMMEMGDRIGQCASRNLLARAMLDQGDVASALDLHRRVLADATRLGIRYEQARALEGIARCLRATDPAAARAHLVRALSLFRQVESPERHEVERLLAELG